MQKTALVIPAHNEENRLDLNACLQLLADNPGLVLCFVNDASDDGTEKMLRRFTESARGRAYLISLARNEGKAQAVRAGMNFMLKEMPDCGWLGFWDADFSTPAADMPLFRAAMNSCPDRTAVIMGSRIRRLGSSIRRNFLRHLLGRCFATAASLTLDAPVYDTQCGAKFFRRTAAEPLFAEPFLTRWLFDVELLARLRAARGPDALVRSAMELPLENWESKAGSKLRLADFIRAPIELLRIRRKYR
ncbi:MAG: glycosyltransferase [Elusimicrobiaceae bacterium]|nr:glycosyltransferase [Elusimicrobiaceae bacterium]